MGYPNDGVAAFSRETVQSTRIMRQLGRTLRKRILRELAAMAEKEPEKFKQFWGEYGRVFKEGMATDPGAMDEILPFLRYVSSKSDGKLTSLDEYIERMPENQEEIYYVLGDDEKSVARSPHLDPFKARDLEVLYWVDPLDAYLAPILPEYKEKRLRNIDDADLQLPALPAEAETEKSGAVLDEKPFNLFVGRCVATLGERIVEVRESKVLKNSPVRLVSPADTADREYQRLQRYFDENYEVPKKILEINRSHPLIINLARMLQTQPDSELVDAAIEQLYESALVQEGLHPNPAQMLPRIEQLMLLATAAANAALSVLAEKNTYQKLEEKSAKLEDGLKQAAEAEDPHVQRHAGPASRASPRCAGRRTTSSRSDSSSSRRRSRTARTRVSPRIRVPPRARQGRPRRCRSPSPPVPP